MYFILSVYANVNTNNLLNLLELTQLIDCGGK